jgi:hypothetical protein
MQPERTSTRWLILPHNRHATETLPGALAWRNDICC